MNFLMENFQEFNGIQKSLQFQVNHVKLLYQVIQAVTFLSPIVGGSRFAIEFGSRKLTIPKKVTKNHLVYKWFFKN